MYVIACEPREFKSARSTSFLNFQGHLISKFTILEEKEAINEKIAQLAVNMPEEHLEKSSLEDSSLPEIISTTVPTLPSSMVSETQDDEL